MKRNNLINIIKFICAILVIYSHSFNLSNNSRDPLLIYSNGIVSFGGLAVSVFFSISGYFITKSIIKNDDFFFKKRIKKIFPSLFVVSVLSIIIFSNISSLSYHDYFINKKTWIYLLNSLGIPVHNLPGVFTNNICESTVNGALWTISVEIGCYIFVYIIKKLKLLDKNKYIVVYIILFIASIFANVILNDTSFEVLLSAIQPFLIFCFSGVIYLNQNKIFNKNAIKINIVLIAICILINKQIFWLIALEFLLPYFIAYISNIKFENISLGILNNISYQMYIVGVPIQQTIIYFYGGTMNPDLNFIISICIDIIIAIIIWYIFDYKLEKVYNKLLNINNK